MEATELLLGGLNGLTEYLSLHVLTCLVPALFIAGAISVFTSQSAVIKYFSPQAKKPVSYGIASLSGAILAVCSCTVLPLFGGIYKRGAGLGPAIAFLYSGPAINILAVVYSARLLGYDLGVARATGAIFFSVVIGLIMAYIFRKEQSTDNTQPFKLPTDESDNRRPWQQVLFFGMLVGILVFASANNWIVSVILIAILSVILWQWFTRKEIILWMKETLRFVRLIVPWLLVGVFIAGIIRVSIPSTVIVTYIGENTITANFIASFGGALMYFATLTEVPIIRSFMELGMGSGPALALLLAGPALSIPNMLVIRNIIGTKKTLTYVALVVIMATITGYIFGQIIN